MAYPLVFGTFYVVLCVVLARNYLHPLRRVPTLPEGLFDVSIPTAAGPTPGWTTKDFGHAKVLFVLAHGYGGTRDTWTPLMRALESHGIDCVAPAMPGQDASPDQTVGFGIKESQMIVDTVAWARTQYAKPPKVVLMGISMGGAATWLASDRVPNVSAVVTEGAYAQFSETMDHWFNRLMPGGSIVFRPVVWCAKAMSHLEPNKIVPLDAARKWNGRPALVIQAEQDKLIEMSHAQRLATVAKAELWVVPEATHARCMEVAFPEYVKRLTALADRVGAP